MESEGSSEGGIKSTGELLYFLKQTKWNIEESLRVIFDSDREDRPTFSASWVLPAVPNDAVLVSHYPVGESEVRLYSLPGRTESLYYVVPTEFNMPTHHMKLLHLAKEELRNFPPTRLIHGRLEEVRGYMIRMGEVLIQRIARENRILLGNNRPEELKLSRRLAEILARYTIGFGILEIPFRDHNVQDIFIDAPASANPLYVTIAEAGGPLFNRCITNMVLTDEESEALLSRLRLESGRPFSEAAPVLEANLEGFHVRATVVGKPLSPSGLAVALRRHSSEPWTLPRLIENGTLSAEAAALLSFLVDGKSTILIAGSRGAGKSSLLSALLFEFPRSQRILTIEDTLELPVAKMQELGFKVQSLYVESTLGSPGQMSADEALRVTLRLGESAIVLGEVRGQEARTLYEAMRAGTAGSAVLGTIHGNSPKAVFERIVHDLSIPPSSFQATDIIVVAGLSRRGGSQRFQRRVVDIAEVLKGKPPGTFQSLMTFDSRSDTLIPKRELSSSSERLMEIATSWGLGAAETAESLRVRSEYRRRMVEVAQKNGDVDMLSAEWVAAANSKYWSLVEDGLSGEELLAAWNTWYDAALRGR